MGTAKKKLPNAFDLKDGSFGSRKFVMAIFAIILLTSIALAGIIYPAVVAILPTFVGGLLGILSLYFTGNVVNKYVTGKNLQNLTETEGAS
jgi:hypothetical protein